MKFKSSLFVGAVALAATSLVAVSANADKLRWKMQSTWGSQVAINGEAAVYFSNKVKSLSIKTLSAISGIPDKPNFVAIIPEFIIPFFANS